MKTSHESSIDPVFTKSFTCRPTKNSKTLVDDGVLFTQVVVAGDKKGPVNYGSLYI